MYLIRLSFVFLVIALFSVGIFAQADTRASATWRVQKYDIAATLPQDIKERTLGAKATLTLLNVSTAPAGTLTLRISPNAAVSAATVNGNTADFSKTEEKINGSNTLQRIVLRFPATAPGGTVTAAIDYKLSVKDNSPLSVISPAGSQFLPLSYWYPTPNSWYFARGADYAPFKISVAAPGGLTVASSGSDSATYFDQKLKGQPFFVSGSWDVVESTGVKVYVPKGSGPDGQKRAADLASIMSEARTFTASLLGTAPDVPLRIISARRAAGFSSGGAVIVDDAVFRRSKVDFQTAMAVAEAAVRLWLGNAVSINGDGHGVISEGLTRYIATQFIESKYGKDVADAERERQRATYATVSKRDAPLNLVAPLDDFYFPEVANKGAMVWRVIAKRVGPANFFNTVKSNIADGSVTLKELRDAFADQKPMLDYFFDQVTDMNLLVGLPQTEGNETKIALRNTGGIDVSIDVAGYTATGESVVAPTTIRATDYGEVTIKSPTKIVRVEVDVEKMYPQTDYWDDIAPKELTDSDKLLAVKRDFDKKDYPAAEKTAQLVLRDRPRFDDVRVLLGRSYLAENKNAEAEREFRAVLDEKLPSARSLAWANVGLAETTSRAGQASQAQKYIEAAILAEGEYGASYAARLLRNKLGLNSASDPSVKSFFTDFDKIVTSNRKADIDAMFVTGEVSRLASMVSGSTEQWQTDVKQVDRIDSLNVLVETITSVKLLTRNPESGLAVYRLTKVGGNWKLAGLDIFEVRPE